MLRRGCPRRVAAFTQGRAQNQNLIRGWIPGLLTCRFFRRMFTVQLGDQFKDEVIEHRSAKSSRTPAEAPMQRRLSSIFWVESVAAASSALLAAMTLVRRDWIERIFGFDPDQHTGAFEWELVSALFLATLLFAALARREWHRTSPAPESGR